jgi:hypothetical protein
VLIALAAAPSLPAIFVITDLTIALCASVIKAGLIAPAKYPVNLLLSSPLVIVEATAFIGSSAMEDAIAALEAANLSADVVAPSGPLGAILAASITAPGFARFCTLPIF